MITLIVFVFVISLLIFVHELGHFVTARKLGVAVEEFGFGFPPRIAGIKRGETIYSINWIPFGGFVRMKGEAPDAPKEPNSFAAQATGRRFVILAAGVFMNYLLAALLFTIGFSIGLPTAVDPGTAPSHVSNVHAEIVSTDNGSPADKAGIKAGDTITAINTTAIQSTDQIRQTLQETADKQVSVVVLRNGKELTLPVVPAKSSDGSYRIGIGISDVGTLSYPFPESIVQGVVLTGNVTGRIFNSFGTLLHDLVIERKVSADLSGPVGVVVLTGQAVRLGWAYLIQFVALLSVTLAVVNFFPLPALDGGRALFVLIEMFRGKPINERVESLIHAIGFYALIALVLLISVHDLQRYDIGGAISRNVHALFSH